MLCSILQVYDWSPPTHSSFQLLTVLGFWEFSLFLVGLAALLSLRKTRWKAHSGQASKGTFPQLQSKFTTTYFSDCRISFLFRIDCYDSRYLAENTPWGLNIFYWRHSLRIRAYFTQWRRAQDLFTLPESREYYTYRFYSVFKQKHKVGEMGGNHFLNWECLCFSCNKLTDIANAFDLS